MKRININNIYAAKSWHKALWLIFIMMLGSLFASLFATAAFAKEYGAKYLLNEETGYAALVLDDGYYLSEEEENELLKDMYPLTAYGNAAFYSFLETGYMDSNTEAFCLDTFGAYENSVVFAVNPNEIYIYSEGRLHDIVTSNVAYTITDEIYTEAKDDNIYNCSVHCYDLIYQVINGRKLAEPMRNICSALMALMISSLICFIYIKKKSTLKDMDTKMVLSSAKREFRHNGLLGNVVETKRVYAPRSSGGSSHGGGGHGGGGGGHHGGGGGHSR